MESLAVGVPVAGDALPLATAVAAPIKYPELGGQALPSVQGSPSQAGVIETLGARGYPAGLARELLASRQHFPLRLWVVDNSGSMQMGDGSRLVPDAAGRMRIILCTRWQELSETVASAGELAATLGARTDFFLLNPSAGAPQHVTVAFDSSSTATDGGHSVMPGRCAHPQEVRRMMSAVSPSGTTPLTEAVQRVISIIEPLAAELQSRGQQAVLTIATDGQPNDPPSFLQAPYGQDSSLARTHPWPPRHPFPPRHP